MALPTPPLPSTRTLATPIRLLPNQVLTAPLQKTINQVFRQSVEEGEFDFLEDRWVKIHISDADLAFYLSFNGDQLVMGSACPCAVEFRGDLQAFRTLALRREDPDTLFFQRRLMIEGDTELGLGLKNLLDSIDIEQLPRTVQTLMKLGNKFQDLTERRK